jgi:hypothetical protein
MVLALGGGDFAPFAWLAGVQWLSVLWVLIVLAIPRAAIRTLVVVPGLVGMWLGWCWWLPRNEDPKFWITTSVPFFAANIALVAYSIVAVARERRRQRVDTPRCAQCGYDLRAGPSRCPECGTQVPGAVRE